MSHPRSAIPKHYWNSQLWFDVADGEIKIDPETGNSLPETKTVEVAAILKPSIDKTKERSQPGTDISEIYVKGYLCDPLQMPIKPPCEVRCEISGKQGRLRIPALIQSPYGAEVRERVIGQKIEGYFLVQGGA